ncbi:TPA: alpha/beta fold hydrolase [Pseudomonas putida]
MAFFEHDRHRYYYFDAGSGTPTLLLHGLGNSGRAWTDQVGALLRLGHRVIVPDLLGHGASGDAPEPVTPRLQAEHLIALLDHLGLASSQVIGLSLGGMVALEMACIHPKAVEKLVVAATFCNMTSTARQQQLDEWSEQLAQTDGCLKHFKATWPALVGSSFAASSQGQSLYQAWHAQATMQRAHCQIRWCKGLKTYDLADRLAQIQAPTLVLGADGDRISPPGEAQAIAHSIPNAQLITLPGDGHVFNVSHAPAFNRALSGFLQEQQRHG